MKDKNKNCAATKRLKYSIKQVLEAINNSGGIKTEVAKRLGCGRKLLYEYIDRFPQIREAFAEEEEKVLDMAESSLFALIQDGDLSAIFYYLNNKGKRRGYAKTDKLAIDNNNAPAQQATGVLVTPGILSESEWEKAARVEGKGNENEKE